MALVVSFWFFVYYKSSSYRWRTQTLVKKQEQIAATQKIVESKGSEENFIKLALAREITKDNTKIPWAEHIKSLINIIQEVQDTDYVGSNVIELSDLSIDDNHLTLEWSVSNLILLYHSVPEKNYKSLIDRFNELDFITTLEIREYKKIGDRINFSLDADISLQNANY